MYNNKRMKIILLQDNKKLGKKGDIVNVSEGFAFNSLFPQGLAEVATKQALAKMEQINKQADKELLEQKKQLEKNAQTINKKKVTIKSQAKDGKLFGSVTKKDIATAIADEHGVTVEENDILLESPLKELTTQEVEIDYGNGVKAGVIVTIVAQ